MPAKVTVITRDELQTRWDRCREYLKQIQPDVDGLFVFSRLNIYYFTGTFGNGLFWLPREGSPVLLCRRGVERARSESPLDDIFPFKSYRDVKGILSNCGTSLKGNIAVEMNGLSWGMSNLFTKHMKGHAWHNADNVISLSRAVKTQWELERIRKAGQMHEKCLVSLLPTMIRPGMTEMEIARIISDLFLEHGHHGILRMERFGEEVYMGYVSSGDSANHSSVFNGALGLRGLHPAVPHMGARDKSWQPHEPLTVDNGFNFEGYQTDKTQVYWAGSRDSIPEKVSDAHKFCIDMQQWISGQLKPGGIPSRIWQNCINQAEKSGYSDGFMGLGENKVPFAGHGIGLAIDEYPVLAEGFDQPLEDSMVIAVEPKIGIEGIGMVGVENTFEVTSSGGRSLTGDEYEILCL